MTTPDWADEEANKLLYYFMRDELEVTLSDNTAFAKAMTTALRAAFLRGRIAGLREAADEVGDEDVWRLKHMADKLEKGEA